MWQGDTERIIEMIEHRPWPLPRAPWVMFQSWRSLLFMHWPVPAEVLRSHVPAPLAIDTFDGTGWLGIVPFDLRDLRVRLLPALPGLSDFPEINVRTYVRSGDHGGIWFFSLDAASTAAVLGARLTFGLPYRRAEMEVRQDGDWIHYRSRRMDGNAEFIGRYRPIGPPSEPLPGTLEHFLTERYALFTVEGGKKVIRGDIHHPPWGLQPAEAVVERNTMAQAAGITLPDVSQLLHFSAHQDALIWAPRGDRGRTEQA